MAQLSDVAVQFESTLLRTLLHESGLGRRAAPADEGQDDSWGSAGDPSTDLFCDMLANALARLGGIGIGRALQRELDPREPAPT